MIARSTFVISAVVLLAASTRGLPAQTFYRSVVVDTVGQLRVTTTTGRAVAPAKDSGQVAFAAPAIAANRRSVGWLALYPNCCTSYPIPLKLVVRTADKDRMFDGAGLPIWRWAFIGDGTRVAFRQTPVHGDAPAHYELRDLASGRMVSSFDEPRDSAMAATKTKASRPRWVVTVDAARVRSSKQ